MKNAFKIGFFALAISVSMVACKGSGSGSTADSAADTTVAVDTAAKMDTTMAPATADTTVAVDTTKKM
ncbi:hypothetical protein MUGA111182_12125 [Mucilaginibacter galii]|uniref:Entericidin n=1 Tax=Mucilaginibacter galii TaxID=2005073 RepID=A0A917N310_9SPHI|nr:hypothetical protein [Mucilaginibacter galii]GGI52039.1 hypothetical protein GCM10011425_32510 [Mucilaginibacter galii]